MSKSKKGSKAADLGLHKAGSKKKVLHYLSQEGVNYREYDHNGDTALHAYVRSNKIDCLFAFLVNAEYKIDVLNEHDDTPLHLAVKMKSMDCVKALVAFDADLNIFNDDIQTPLDIANANDYKDIAQLLEDVGGLTNMAILEPEDNFKKEMDKGVMDMSDVQEIPSSYGGATGLIRGGGEAKNNHGGSNFVRAESKLLQDTRRVENEGVTYQRQRGTEEADCHIPKTMIYSIPEIEEVQTPDPSVMGPITQLFWPESLKEDDTGTPLKNPSPSEPKNETGTMSPEGVTKEQTDGRSSDRLDGKPKVEMGARCQAEGTVNNELEEATDLVPGGPVFEFKRSDAVKSEMKPRVRHQNSSQRPVHYVEPGKSIRQYRLRGSRAALESSISRTRSVFNPRIAVIKSELGISSVVPKQISALVGTQRGERILCLDGGGIKGVIELEILRAIERISGCAIPELFDWIVGTSIGGIITLGMVYGKKDCSYLQKLFFKMKDSVYKNKSLFRCSCDTEALKEILIDMLGKETVMKSEVKPKVMITAIKKEDTSLPIVFFNNCFEEYSDGLVWEAARSTSAAPIYFKSHGDFMDGGLLANNPCNHALSKIKMFLKDQHGPTGSRVSCLVSLGCGALPAQSIGNIDIEDLDITKIFQAKDRIQNVIQTLIACIGRSEEDAQICRFFCEEMDISYHRLNPQVGVDVGITESDSLKICDCIISAKKMVYKDEAHLTELVRNLGKEPIPITRVNSSTTLNMIYNV